MRNTLLKLSLLAAAISPLAARAASLDQLVVTGNGSTWTYLLPASPAESSVVNYFDTSVTPNPLLAIELPSVQDTTVTGGHSTVTFDDMYFYTGYGGGAFYDGTNFLNLLADTTQSFFNDSMTAPTFLAVSGLANDGSSPADNIVYTYSLTPYTAPAAAPEPSSLILLGTGALGIAGAMRRRLFA